MSPRLLGVADRMRRVLERADRPVVIEITEHEPIVDYAAVRAAVVALGPEMRLAGHIIELRPDS